MKVKGLVFVCLLISSASYSQGNWQLKKDSDGIKVYVREVEGSDFKEIKVTLTCRSTLNEFKELITDINNHKRWMSNINSLQPINRINQNELQYYVEISLPWPASNRDVNVHLKVISDSILNTIYVVSTSIEDGIPVNREIVRVPFFKTLWEVMALNDQEIKINYLIQLDPGGSLTPWLVNLTAVTGPFNSFYNLKNILESSNTLVKTTASQE